MRIENALIFEKMLERAEHLEHAERLERVEHPEQLTGSGCPKVFFQNTRDKVILRS